MQSKMFEFIGKVISEGRVTIPKKVRELLEIQEGDYVRLRLLEIAKKETKVVEAVRA